jgi:hypothetical protein
MSNKYITAVSRKNKAKIDSWDDQVNIARAHARLFHQARELLNKAVNALHKDLDILQFDQEIYDSLSKLLDDTFHYPQDLDVVIEESNINNIYTKDEQCIIDDDREYQEKEIEEENNYKLQVRSDYYAGLL